MNADLHCHSIFSDGVLTPSQLVCRALANGVEMLALTDHDETAGLDEALAAARTTALQLITGVEISVSWQHETLHVLGLNLDHHHPLLAAGLERSRSGRLQRAERMDAALAAIGIPDALAGARRFARNPSLIGRAHFARQLVACGIAKDVRSVFHHYLVPGKPGFVDHAWPCLDEALSWIHTAGGVAVLAHPARCRLSSADMAQLLNQFSAKGGQALEVISSAHSPADEQRFARLARRYGLLASRASDFHSASESPVDLGACGALPTDLTPVWTLWQRL